MPLPDTGVAFLVARFRSLLHMGFTPEELHEALTQAVVLLADEQAAIAEADTDEAPPHLTSP